MNYTDRATQLELLETFRPLMTKNYPRDFTNLTELIDVGESRIAFENLITDLHEFDIVISQTQSQDLQDLITLLAPNDYQEYLDILSDLKVSV